jgi:hypothetical protein
MRSRVLIIVERLVISSTDGKSISTVIPAEAGIQVFDFFLCLLDTGSSPV